MINLTPRAWCFILGGLVVFVLCLGCLLAPALAPHDPQLAELSQALRSPDRSYLLGTDELGRCVLSRLLAGAPLTVFSALGVVLFTLLIGCAVGIICGYRGGWLDSFLMRIVDIFQAFPETILALAVVGTFGKGTLNAIIAMGVADWTGYARLARSTTLALKEENFIAAAKLNGQAPHSIWFKHLLPSVLRPLAIEASLQVGAVILGLSGLSFLGLGAQPPVAEWGNMLADGRNYLQQAPWLVFAPGLAICFVTVVFNLFGDLVRDVLDPGEERPASDLSFVKGRGRTKIIKGKMKMKKILTSVLVLMVMIIGLGGCGSERTAEKEGDFILGVMEVSQLDPADDYNGWATIRYGAGETLFILDEALNVKPHLVTNYKLSDDQLSWTFTLRDNVLFHNNKKLDAKAVKSCLERLVATHPRAATDLMIGSIEASGQELTIRTAVPNPTLTNALCDPYACIIDVTAEDRNFNERPVGTGPFVVKDYQQGASVTLEAFDSYWQGPPKSKRVLVKGITDLDTLSLAMQNGEIDAAYGLPYDKLALFKDDDDFRITQAETSRVYMLYYNLEKPWLNDPAFRRAVTMLTDKDSYASILLGGAGTPTKAAFPSFLPYGDDSLMSDVPDYDPQGAMELLVKSGYVDTDHDGILEKDGQKVSLRLITYQRAGLPETAQALQGALREAGIDVQYEFVDNISAQLTAGNFDICVYAFVTTPTGDPYSYLSFTTGTGKGSNFGGYSNAGVDALLDELATEFDPVRRGELATEIQQHVTADSSYSYLFHLNMFMVTKAEVVGIVQSPVDYYIITAETGKE